MSYAVQLLPTAGEARVIRDALIKYEQEHANLEESDICWKYISKISIGLTEKRPER